MITHRHMHTDSTKTEWLSRFIASKGIKTHNQTHLHKPTTVTIYLYTEYKTGTWFFLMWITISVCM